MKLLIFIIFSALVLGQMTITGVADNIELWKSEDITMQELLYSLESWKTGLSCTGSLAVCEGRCQGIEISAAQGQCCIAGCNSLQNQFGFSSWQNSLGQAITLGTLTSAGGVQAWDAIAEDGSSMSALLVHPPYSTGYIQGSQELYFSSRYLVLEFAFAQSGAGSDGVEISLHVDNALACSDYKDYNGMPGLLICDVSSYHGRHDVSLRIDSGETADSDHIMLIDFYQADSVPQATGVNLDNIYKGDMVVQQGRPFAPSGYALSGGVIDVETDYGYRKAITDVNNKWSVEFPAMQPSFDESPLIINSVEQATFKVGDVWLCAGQSNMAWPVSSLSDSATVIQASPNDNLRLLKAGNAWGYNSNLLSLRPKAQLATNGWHASSLSSVPGFSAVCYFFGKELQDQQNIPIGLMDTSWSATMIESWMSKDALWKFPAYQSAVADIVNSADIQSAPSYLSTDAGSYVGEINIPTVMYNTMISQLDMEIKGAAWYQGESNVRRAYEYRTLFPALIQDWRGKWGYDFPFLYVQLANFGIENLDIENDYWAELRQAQLEALSVPGTGMAVAIDIGESGNIHPDNKQEVGRRLANIARANVYREAIEPYSPFYHSIESIEGNVVTLNFYHGRGLHIDGQELLGFMVAGPDFNWYDAQGYVSGEQVLVGNPGITNPVAVRYDYSKDPSGNLYNSANLPACPFRTDSLPWVTQGNSRYQ